jgi:hypothetical protein
MGNAVLHGAEVHGSSYGPALRIRGRLHPASLPAPHLRTEMAGSSSVWFPSANSNWLRVDPPSIPHDRARRPLRVCRTRYCFSSDPTSAPTWYSDQPTQLMAGSVSVTRRNETDPLQATATFAASFIRCDAPEWRGSPGVEAFLHVMPSHDRYAI